ncbi:MAG: heme-binding protein [Haloarculaceae archaeon]
MKRTTLALGAAGLLATAFAGRRYVQDRTTPRVPYETIDAFDGAEIRRYPPTVLVETVAPTQNAAFRRLFRYITGTNRSATDVAMTTPVETDRGATVGEEIAMTAPVESPVAGPGGAGAADASESVSMTTPVESDRGEEGVRMAFYLPAEYDFESAPRPTDESVRLVEQPGRTLAVKQFSWWATDGRVARQTDALRDALAAAGDRYEAVGEPVLLRYEGPGVPPFLRTNEVAIPVRRASAP